MSRAALTRPHAKLAARRIARRAVCLVGVLVAIGCSSDSPEKKECVDEPVDAAPRPFPCDVDAVLQAKCRRCHDLGDRLQDCYAAKTCLIAPFPLASWSDTRLDIGDGVPIYVHMGEAVKSGVMPYQTTEIQPPVEKLTDGEKKTLLDWIDDCAPPGTSACPSP